MLLGLTSCSSSRESVKYSIADNYFVRNDAVMPHNRKIMSQEEFDKCFGAAAYMGKHGQPTEIDFQKNFVIADIMHVTDTLTHISPLTLKNMKGRLLLESEVKTGGKMSYFMQPCYIIVVSRKYADCDVEISRKFTKE